MKTSAECILCLMNRDLAAVPPGVSAAERTAFLRELFRLVADADPSLSTPELSELTKGVFARRFGERRQKDYDRLKRVYNERMLALEPQFRATVEHAPDPLAAAIRLARAGNYIDFGSSHVVEDAKLDALLAEAGSGALDPAEYARLREDLNAACRAVYITDNAGEIVLDKLLLQTLTAEYPRVEWTLLVRGAPTLNDATVEDAQAVGLTGMLPVVGNGNACPGPVWPLLSDEARTLLGQADVLLAKGQANFETMNGCGLNAYYLLLCKCDYFVRRFRVPRLTGLFLNERRLPPAED